MKNLVILFLLLFFYQLIGLSFCISSTDSSSVRQKTEQANYILARHVIGSGGVLSAKSSNHSHSATAGQTIVGRAQGANNIVVAGFWKPIAGSTEVSPPEKPSLPTEFALYQNYPNPFNPFTQIIYQLPKSSVVTLKIYNLQGQVIKTLVDEFQAAGTKSVIWDGLDQWGKKASSGLYFYRIEADGFAASKRMNLIK